MQTLLTDHDMPVILANNVAEYFETLGETKHWDLMKDFPNLAPQFPTYWIEYHWQIKSLHASLRRARIGVLVTGLNPTKAPPEVREHIPDGTRWILGCDIYAEHDMPGKSAYRQIPMGRVVFWVGETGDQVAPPKSQFMDLGADPDLSAAGVFIFVIPALLTICFLHCKNVKVVENKVDPALARKQREKLGFPPTKYKTLVIEPLKEILRTQGGAHETGLKKAMHICRGHFADYTGGKGLFGKYHGKFWIPSTVRGSKRKDETAPPREIEVKI